MRSSNLTMILIVAPLLGLIFFLGGCSSSSDSGTDTKASYCEEYPESVDCTESVDTGLTEEEAEEALDGEAILEITWEGLSYTDQTNVCDGYWMDSESAITIIRTGNEDYVTRDEIDTFLAETC